MADKEHMEQTKAANGGAAANASSQAAAGKYVPSPERLDLALGTEALLNSLIAECHYAISKVAIPGALKTTDIFVAERCLTQAMDIAKAGAVVGKTVAMLRAADQPMEGGILEHVSKLLPAIAKNG
jgi:hypothetical protein